MLDALIEQLDGVELKDDGRIFVNGKYVESLLLNGKDFFKGDRRVMLDNLPAYMVDKVKVYEKGSEMASVTGRKEYDKPLVVDVNLKRQYLKGIISNAEAAGGTDDRYLLRLFGLRLTGQSRLSAFGNMNNVNETRKPGRNGDWTPDDLSGGMLTTKAAGIDYTVDDMQRKWQVNGSAKFGHDNSDLERNQNTQTFLLILICSSEMTAEFMVAQQHFPHLTPYGYSYSDMNGTHPVWNARLTKSIAHGNLVFMLDGFDILGELDNVTYNIGAQSRTETWTNSIPRYAMLHVVVKLNKQPSKGNEK